MQNGEYMNFATAKSMIIEGSNSLVQQANITIQDNNGSACFQDENWNVVYKAELMIIISSGEIIIYDENEDLEDGAIEDSKDKVDEEDVDEEDSDASPSERVISRTSGVVRGRHSSSPKTGDGNEIMIFVGIAIVSGVAIVYVKKKNVCKQDR